MVAPGWVPVGLTTGTHVVGLELYCLRSRLCAGATC